MLNIEINPLKWYEDFKRAEQIDQWLKLFVSLFLSYVGTFSFVCGGAMLVAISNHASPGTAIVIGVAAGMVKAVIACTYVWRRSPVARGQLALPQAEAEAEMSGKDPIQVITKN